MFRIFTKRPFRGTRVNPGFLQAKAKFTESVKTAHLHYATFDKAINNRHILIRLVAGFSFDPDLPDETIYRIYQENSNRIATGLGITTDINPGDLHKNALYTDECALISMSFSNALSIKDQYWRNMRPVRVLTHPHASLALVLPHVMSSVEKTDYAVVGIDIPLLAVQFKHWFITNREKPALEKENLSQFIYKNVLANMLPEQVDIALRNRFCLMAKQERRDEPNWKPPIHIVDYDDEFDRAYRTIIENLNDGARTLSEAMKIIPMVNKENYWEAIPNGLDSLSNYSYWVYLLIYTDWLYPIAVGVETLDPIQEDLYKRLRIVERYVKGTRSDRFIEPPVETLWRMKYETILKNWTDLRR